MTIDMIRMNQWHWLTQMNKQTAILQRGNIFFTFEWGFDEMHHVNIEERETYPVPGMANVATTKGTKTCEVPEARDIWSKLKGEGFMRRLP